MLGLLSIVVLGFFLGMRHATDPDHVIAISTVVSRHRSIKHAFAIGALWGVGHTVTIVLVGAGIVLFGWIIPPRIGLSMELSVGFMLILLGTLNLTGILQWVKDSFTAARCQRCGNQDDDNGCNATHPFHGRTHSDYRHTHTNSDDPETHRRDPMRTHLSCFDHHFVHLGLYNIIRPFVVGLVHGLTGSAAVALLVLSTIHNPKWAVAYLLLFGVGTIAGMMLITGAMGAPFAYARSRSRLGEWLSVGSGLISLGFGCFIVYQIVVVSGLFAAYPNWTPR
jgi:high-affinity nickel permease